MDAKNSWYLEKKNHNDSEWNTTSVRGEVKGRKTQPIDWKGNQGTEKMNKSRIKKEGKTKN